jgi:DNA-binding XRE family transcriptional regulator
MAKMKSADTIREEFGEAIRIRRKALKLSQHQLAESAGIRKATLIDIEYGRPCELNTLLTIIGVLKGRLIIEW